MFSSQTAFCSLEIGKTALWLGCSHAVARCFSPRMLPAKLSHFLYMGSVGAFAPYTNIFLRSCGLTVTEAGFITGIGKCTVFFTSRSSRSRPRKEEKRVQHLTVFVIKKNKLTRRQSSQNGFENYKLTGMILIDLQKAFDTIDHKLLLQKMEYLGFAESTINWFTSYLANRTSIRNSLSQVI